MYPHLHTNIYKYIHINVHTNTYIFIFICIHIYRYYTSLEELKLLEMQVSELQKKITEDASKLKHKQNIYDTIRSDRNLYNKQVSIK
jgi:hypothetical protein